MRPVFAALLALLALLGPAASASPAPSATGAPVGIPAPGHTPRLPTTVLTVMAMGDSITAGDHVTPGASGYRRYVDEALPQPHVWLGSLVDGHGLRHEGHSGWTCGQLADQARAWVAATKPQYILVDCGTNDAGNDHNLTGAQILADLQRLIAEIRAGSPGSIIIVAQPTITVINTAAQQAALNAYDDAIPLLGLTTVDMRGVPIAVSEGGDGVHPGDAGDREMARRWMTVLPAVSAS